MNPTTTHPEIEKRIPRVVVVGAGISGLAAAYRLEELSQKEKFPIELLIAESSRHLGGIISTVEEKGSFLEEGPDAIFTEKQASIDFCERVGLADEIIEANKNSRTTFVSLKNKLIPVPDGFFLLAPTKIMPVLTTPLFSWRAKLRMAFDFFIPKKSFSGPNADETVASFITRRLGKEVYERMVQPVISGIFSADPRDLSLKATFPAFLEMEQKYGSIIKGVLAKMKEGQTSSGEKRKYDLFISFKGGMKSLAEKILEKLPENSFQRGLEIKRIVKTNQSGRSFKMFGEHYEIGVDAVCLALPAYQSAKILKTFDSKISSQLERIPYGSAISVNLVYRKKDIRARLDGFGFVVPEIEKKTINGSLFSSVKFEKRVPDHEVLIRAFIGGRQADNLMKMEESKIEMMVRRDLKDILKIEVQPLRVKIHRYPNSIPVYKIGHLELVERIENGLKPYPGLSLTGNGYYGSGVSECIINAERSAEKLFNDLKTRWKG